MEPLIHLAPCRSCPHRRNIWLFSGIQVSGCFQNPAAAGATALRGFLGFGANSRIHTSKVLRLSEDLPVVVEIVDEEDRIEAFLPELEKWISEGLITLEKVRVIAYRHSPGN